MNPDHHEQILLKFYSEQLFENSRNESTVNGNNRGDADGGSIVDKEKRTMADAIVVNKNRKSKRGISAQLVTEAFIGAKHFTEYKCSPAADFNPRISRASVPKSIAFFKRLPLTQIYTNFEGQLKIRNKSNLVISYSVQTSAPSKFHMTPNPHWISPHSDVLVEIRTRKNRANNNRDNNDVRFEDILNEFFVVFVTPIFREDHLEPKNLDIIWRALGTDLFPYYQAEEHIVDIKIAFPEVFPKCSTHYVTDFSVLDLISLWKEIWPVRKIIKNAKVPEVEEFKSLWSNNHVNANANNGVLRGAEVAGECRSRELRRSLRRCELKVKGAQRIKFKVIAFAMILLSIVLMFLAPLII